MDLNRSVRLLEDALSPHGKSLLRTGTPRKVGELRRNRFNYDDPQLEITNSSNRLEAGGSIVDESLRKVLQKSSITGTTIITEKPWENAADALFMENLEVIQNRTNVQEILETVSDLSQCCTDTLNVIRGLKAKVRMASFQEKWLENERNTWRLINCLYQERLYAMDGMEDVNYLGLSEKKCIENLYTQDSLMRETQIIIDWLEFNERDHELDETKIQYYTDKSIGWENTLHQLQASKTIVFKSSREIVKSLHPDVIYTEKLPLHDIDAEDEIRLSRKIFREIRCGRFQEARELSIHCGHPWRAAMLEGWKLHHDPNLFPDENDDANNKEITTVNDDNGLKPVEGNCNRDIWKKVAWEYCKQEKINIYDRATIAAFCGALETLLIVSSTWEDQLWAYMKTMIDIRVESQIRDFIRKAYRLLPDEYWKNKMSTDEIFDILSSSSNLEVKEESNSPYRIVQKYIILDNIPQLMIEIESWLNTNMNHQLLRFLAHLILFLKQIGKSQRDDIAEKVLEAYVECLMERNEPQILAYYVATLSQQTQVRMYAKYLENIIDNDERLDALSYGEKAGLNVIAITKLVVENIRNRPESFDDANLQRTMTEADKTKIAALDWVLFYPEQRTEAIIQCNTLICRFLAFGRIDAAKAAFSKIASKNAIETITSAPTEEISEQVTQVIKEYFSYKTYLDAHESFNDWFKHFHNSKPIAPPPLAEGASFTEKITHDHLVSKYKAETERWKLTIAHLAKNAKTNLYNVLLFPDGGWLAGCENRTNLRSICIPETVLLLYSVLSESGEHTECLRLADLISSEKYQLYKVYSKNKLEDILQKFMETSIILLDGKKKDMWGH